MTRDRQIKDEIPSSRRSLILDPVHPRDMVGLNFTYACEQCSHFDVESGQCTIGYESKWHLKEEQLKRYELTGRMAFCRFMEID